MSKVPVTLSQASPRSSVLSIRNLALLLALALAVVVLPPPFAASSSSAVAADGRRPSHNGGDLPAAPLPKVASSIAAPSPTPRATATRRSGSVPSSSSSSVGGSSGSDPPCPVGGGHDAPPPQSRCVEVYNANTDCEYRVPQTTLDRPELDAAFLDRCGGPVTGRSSKLPTTMPDPMLVCNEWNRHVVSWVYSYYRGYYELHPKVAEAMPSERPPFLHSIFSDFGCFTASRGPAGTFFVNVGHQRGWGFVGLVNRTRQVIDLSSSFLIQYAKAGEVQRSTARTTVGLMLRGRELVATAIERREIVKLKGDVLLLPGRYTWNWLALQLEELFVLLGRAFTSGVLDLPELTIVIHRADDDRDHAMRAWIEPWLAPIKVFWLREGVVVEAERPWFVPVLTIEPFEPCTPHFMSQFLLPRILAAVRKDPSFKVPGDDAAVRANTAITDEAWARQTFPKRLAIMKQSKHSRNLRVFAVHPSGRELLESMGYVWHTDDTPLHFRIALVNFAEQIVTSYGSLWSLTSLMLGARTAAEVQQPMRMVVLMHPRYYEERTWTANRRCRIGTQNGTSVLVTDMAAYQAPGAWSKLIYTEHRELSADKFSRELLEFKPEDCTTNAAAATDFRSREYVSGDPRSQSKRQYHRMSTNWRAIPKFGLRCPMHPQYDDPRYAEAAKPTKHT